MIIKPLFITAMETALNQYLKLDEDINLFLQPLTGKVIAINVQPFELTFYLCPTTETIQLLESYQGKPDTTLTGSLAALGLMGLSSKPIHSIISGEVKIEGDMETGQKFQELFEKLDIDLEEKLSEITGDVIAHKIGQFFRSGNQWSAETIETFRLNLAEFLQDETRDLPPAPEIDLFFRRVDALRADYDRLQNRVDRLKSAMQSQA